MYRKLGGGGGRKGFWGLPEFRRGFLPVNTAGCELTVGGQQIAIFPGNPHPIQESEGSFLLTFPYNHFPVCWRSSLGVPDLTLLSFYSWNRISLAAVVPTVRITASFVQWLPFHCVHNDCRARKFKFGINNKLSLGPIFFRESGLMEVKNSFSFYHLCQSFYSHLCFHLTYLILFCFHLTYLIFSKTTHLSARYSHEQLQRHNRTVDKEIRRHSLQNAQTQCDTEESWRRLRLHRHTQAYGGGGCWWHGGRCACRAGGVMGWPGVLQRDGHSSVKDVWELLRRCTCACGNRRQAHQRCLGRRLFLLAGGMSYPK